MRYVILFCRFWYDFIIGEDWRLAAGVVAALALGAVLAAGDALSDTALALVVAGTIVFVVITSVLAGALAGRRR